MKDLLKTIKMSEGAVAEAIENNVRKLIIKEQAINPKYHEKMCELLDALIEQRLPGVLEYEKYLASIAELTKQAATPNAVSGNAYPTRLDNAAKRAFLIICGATQPYRLLWTELGTR